MTRNVLTPVEPAKIRRPIRRRYDPGVTIGRGPGSMTFDSLTFLCFFVVVLVLHRLPFSWTVKKFNLLWTSYLFYAAWNPPFIVLLWFSTLADWHFARGLAVLKDGRARRALMAASLVVNLGLLGVFKYGEFLLENFTTLMRTLGIAYQAPEMDIILPVGISFYTFQTLSYTIDVYRRTLKPPESFADYALFVTFFPQLVAGPIVRAADFLPQLPEPRRVDAQRFTWGIALLIVGLFEKTVLADSVFAPMVEQVYETMTDPAPFAAWVGTLAFAGQIFCDFSGYSLCAIGAAMCLGFWLPDNFRFPYAAIGFSDFWRRWHISLSSWLRDYLYISLGGNRISPMRTRINLMLTMLLGGLWHGASWTFVIWGGLHGAYLVIERILHDTFGGARVWSTAVGRLFLGALTFVAVCFAWVYFRADTLAGATTLVVSMLGLSGGAETLGYRQALPALVALAALLAGQWLLRDDSLEELNLRLPRPAIAIVLALMLTTILLTPSVDRAFIYFQF